jgi:hypothetical protein
VHNSTRASVARLSEGHIMLRLVMVTLAVSALTIQAASGDEVHRIAFADAVVGSWAQRAELCGTKDQSNVTIATKTFTDADGTCSVETIVERAGEPGPIYSARGRCADGAGKFHAAYLIVRTEGGDKFSMGTTLSALKLYQRCPAK